MRTFARREGDEWVINGQKVFSTGAGAKNNIISLYAKTDNSVHYRKGISLFLVDNTLPGIRLRKLDTLGRRSLGTYEVFFDNVRIPADCIVGEPNRGWDYMLSGLQLERLMTTAAYRGAAQDVVDQAVAYAKERKQFGKPIATRRSRTCSPTCRPTSRRAASLDAALRLAARAGQGRAQGAVHGQAVRLRSLRARCNNGMQIMGGYGYIKEFDMQRHFRDARVTTITAAPRRCSATSSPS